MGQFARETAVEQISDKHFRGELCEGWRIGAVPNGGYVMAVAGRTLRAVLPHKDPLTVSAFYLAPTDLGPIDCYVEFLGGGRSTSFAEVKMYQHGELKVKVTAAFTDLDKLKGESWARLGVNVEADFDPLYIIPVVMGLSMFAVTKVGLAGMPPNPQSKMMLYFLPVMMTVMFVTFASGLNLYYAVQNIVSIPQQWYLAKERLKAKPPEVGTKKG